MIFATNYIKMLRIKSKQWLNPFTNKQLFGFTVYTNQLFSPFEIIDGQRVNYDNNIEQYEPIIQAYLQKRRTQKHEIGKIFKIIIQFKKGKSFISCQNAYIGTFERNRRNFKNPKIDKNDKNA